MTKYRLENVNTGAHHYVEARDRKAAHEIGQAIWPGQIVEVCSEQEYHDRRVFYPEREQILDWLDGAQEAIGTERDGEIVRALDAIQRHIQSLKDYFTAPSRKARQGA